jgi:hypothetical protein
MTTRLFLIFIGLGFAAAGHAAEMRFGEVVDFALRDRVELTWEAACCEARPASHVRLEDIDWGPRPALGAGQKWAVVTVTLTKGLSIGKYDYTLSGAPCVAIATNDGPFDPRTWQQVYEPAVVDVHLLYTVAEAEGAYLFSMSLLGSSESVTLEEGEY